MPVLQNASWPQQENAILITFNEVNMKTIMDFVQYKEKFEKEHGVKSGFMSFFVKVPLLPPLEKISG